MTVAQGILTIAVVMLGTMFTRFLPFILFPSNRKPPEYIKYLGSVLPFAVMGLLIVYCLRNAVFTEYHALPEALAILLIVLLHRLKKSILLSIGGGTIFYMLLVQYVF